MTYRVRPEDVEWNIPGEEWRPVVGYEGLYEVSSLGRVKTLPRTATHRNGHTRRVPAYITTGASGADGYPGISLPAWGSQPRKNVRVHTMVATAFIGPRPNEMCVAHADGVRHNNALANLRYATAEENAQDARVHGGNAPAARTHCPRGHILEPPNLVLGALARGGRNCLACGRAAREVSRLRSLGKTVTPYERQRISDRKFAALTGLTICDCDKDTR